MVLTSTCAEVYLGNKRKREQALQQKLNKLNYELEGATESSKK